MKASPHQFRIQQGNTQLSTAGGNYGQKSYKTNGYAKKGDPTYPQKFTSNFFNAELDRLQLIDHIQKKYLLRALNDGKAPGKYTIGRVRQYDENGTLLQQMDGSPQLKDTRGEHVLSLQKAYNLLLPEIQEACAMRNIPAPGRVMENGIYNANFQEAIKIMQQAGGFKYQEGYVGPETLYYMDKILRKKELGDEPNPEPTPQEEEENTKGMKKRVRDAFEIAFNEDVKREVRDMIEKYEYYAGHNWNDDLYAEENKNPIAVVEGVQYEGGIIADGTVDVYNGQLNVYGEILDATILYKRGGHQAANTIGQINYLGKDVTFKNLMGGFHQVKGNVFRITTTPYDVRFRIGDRLQEFSQEDVERTLAFVSLSDDGHERLNNLHRRASLAGARDHFVKSGRERDYWKARANIVFYEDVQRFTQTYGSRKSPEELQEMLNETDFMGEYIVAMENFIRLDPRALSKEARAEFEKARASYKAHQKSNP